MTHRTLLIEALAASVVGLGAVAGLVFRATEPPKPAVYEPAPCVVEPVPERITVFTSSDDDEHVEPQLNNRYGW